MIPTPASSQAGNSTGAAAVRPQPIRQLPIGPRSIALVGPYGSGKSTLYDRLLAAAGAVARKPSEQRAVDSRGRGMTTELALAHCTYLDDPWAIIDCPGSIEFAAEAAAALAAVDLAVIVCEPAPERALALAPLFRMLEAGGIPHVLFINKIDTATGRIRDLLAALQAVSTRPLVLRQVPIREGEQITGYVDVVSERAYRYRAGQPSELIQLPPELVDREQEALGGLVEVLADHDDGLLEKVLEDIQPSSDEIYRQLRKDQAAGAIVEVLLGAAALDHGIRRLWKALRHDVPSSEETAARLGVAPDGEPLVQVFKTVHAPHTGKLSYARVWRGPIKDGAVLGGARVAGLFRLPSGEPTKTAEAAAGDLVGLGRMDGVATGAVLTASGTAPALSFPTPPAPVYALALATEKRTDDVKLSGALQKLVEEDPSLVFEHNAESSEMVLHGQGEIHLQAAIDKLGRLHNLNITTTKPQVPFRETIRRRVDQHARLKRQTGGHGQFADVHLEIRPQARGEGVQFGDRIVGGSVPKQYIPAVGEGVRDSLHRGPLGHPVVDIAVTLTSGTFHTVDSSDMAFKTAARLAMTEGLPKAEPVLLEPIDHVAVSVPNEFTAKAQRLITGRRGQLLGYAERPGWPGWDEVEALVPEAELQDFIIELRSQTLGLGSFVRRFDHLAEVRGRNAERGAHAVA